MRRHLRQSRLKPFEDIVTFHPSRIRFWMRGAPYIVKEPQGAF